METTENEITDSGTNGKGKKERADQNGRRSYFMFDPDECIIIGFDTDDGPEHPYYDKRVKLLKDAALDEAMVRNIQAHGILRPILFVRDGDKVIVLDGRRRVVHAREAKKRQDKAGEVTVMVPGMPKRGDEKTLFGISRSSNRFAVVDGPLDDAYNAQRMLDMGSSEEEIAIFYGVKVQTVKDWLTLLGLAPKVKAAVEKKTLSPSAAAGLAKLSKEEQEKHLDELIAQGAKPTVDAVINKVRASKGKAPTNTPKVRIEKAENLLSKAAARWNDFTKDELVELVDKLSKALLSKGIGKLQAEIEKELAGE